MFVGHYEKGGKESILIAPTLGLIKWEIPTKDKSVQKALAAKLPNTHN